MTSDDMKATVEAASFAQLILQQGFDITPVVAERCLVHARHVAELWYAANKAECERRDAIWAAKPRCWPTGRVPAIRNPDTSAYLPFRIDDLVILELRVEGKLCPKQQPQPTKRLLKFGEVFDLRRNSENRCFGPTSWNYLREWLEDRSWVVRLAKDCDDK